MKYSGVEWIGKIPDDWKTSRIKYVSEFMPSCRVRGLKKEDTVTYAPMECIKNGYHLARAALLGDIPDSLTAFEEGDIVIAKVTPCFENGNIAIMSNLPAKIGFGSSELFVLRPKKIQPRFLLYWMRNPAFLLEGTRTMTGMGGLKRVSSSFIANSIIPFPDSLTQNKICDFLDMVCKKADDLSEDINQQIGILEAYKRSIITETVTKGLDHASLKDSGIEWIGEIPSHWDVLQNKYLMKKVKTICPVYKGEDILSLTTSGVIIRDLNAGGKMPASFDGYQRIKAGNLLMCLFDIDVTPRCIGLIMNDGLTSPAYSQFSMQKGAYAPYYYYYYLMLDMTKELLHLAKNLRHSLTEDQLGSIPTVRPPFDEQVAIAEYLNKKCNDIDTVIARKQEQLRVLGEYKQEVIYEYSSGKKEVPSA